MPTNVLGEINDIISWDSSRVPFLHNQLTSPLKHQENVIILFHYRQWLSEHFRKFIDPCVTYSIYPHFSVRHDIYHAPTNAAVTEVMAWMSSYRQSFSVDIFALPCHNFDGFLSYRCWQLKPQLNPTQLAASSISVCWLVHYWLRWQFVARSVPKK